MHVKRLRDALSAAATDAATDAGRASHLMPKCIPTSNNASVEMPALL